jgi:hypothetical protein
VLAIVFILLGLPFAWSFTGYFSDLSEEISSLLSADVRFSCAFHNEIEIAITATKGIFLAFILVALMFGAVAFSIAPYYLKNRNRRKNSFLNNKNRYRSSKPK